MRKLYHFKLSPFSRIVRIIMHEKNLSFSLVDERFWERRREFLIMNPAAQVPVLIEESEAQFSDCMTICEYLEEQYPDKSMIGDNITERAETRRISGWFNNKFYYEVTKHVLEEKIFKHYCRQGPPNSDILRVARNNILYHLDYIAHLTKKNQFLAGNSFSRADATAAAHISVLDYLGEVPWSHNKNTKEWYAVVKSRPSFRDLLHDKVAGFRAPSHYDDLDF